MAKSGVEKKVPHIFTFWVVSYMPCQFDKFDNNIKKKSRNTIKTWLCRQLMWQPWREVTQYTMRPKIWATAVLLTTTWHHLINSGFFIRNFWKLQPQISQLEAYFSLKIFLICSWLEPRFLIFPMTSAWISCFMYLQFKAETGNFLKNWWISASTFS